MLGRVLAATAIASAAARADPCATEARQLREVLLRDRHDADTWNLEWRIGLTGATVVNAALAATPSLSTDTRTASLIGAVQSALGAAGQWVMPLRIDVPVLTGDACADANALRLATQRAAHQQRTAFWLGHAGALAVTAAGSIVLAERTGWKNGAISAAIGYPIGLLHIYTMRGVAGQLARRGNAGRDRDRRNLLIQVYSGSMRIMVGVVVVSASTARADISQQPTPFDQGHFEISVIAGSESSFNQRYIVFGAGLGYFALDGVEIEAAADHWFGDGPSVSMVSPGVRYVAQPLVHLSPVVPYVGGFYRHWFVGGGFEDIDGIGARAGIEYLNGRIVVGIGVGYEHTISTCTQDCDQVYPELSLGFTF